jgi:hypothetical protein
MRSGIKGLGNGDILEGRYANYFEIGHNAFEFLMDFGQLYLEDPEGRMHTRIVTSPMSARRLAEVLNRALRQHEQRHGRIPGEAEEPNETGARNNVRPIQTGKIP